MVRLCESSGHQSCAEGLETETGRCSCCTGIIAVGSQIRSRRRKEREGVKDLLARSEYAPFEESSYLDLLYLHPKVGCGDRRPFGWICRHEDDQRKPAALTIGGGLEV